MTLRCKCLCASLVACRVRSTICRLRSGHTIARRTGRYLLWSDVVGDETGRALLCGVQPRPRTATLVRRSRGRPHRALMVAVAGRGRVKLPCSCFWPCSLSIVGDRRWHAAPGLSSPSPSLSRRMRADEPPMPPALVPNQA